VRVKKKKKRNNKETKSFSRNDGEIKAVVWLIRSMKITECNDAFTGSGYCQNNKLTLTSQLNGGTNAEI